MGAPLSRGVPAATRPAARLAAGLGPVLLFAMATVVMTWPLGRDLRTAVYDHDDGLFGVWRMAWVAHQLPRAPGALFDANVFSPTPGTLALSDAALMQGLLAAPALWLGARPVTVYNVLLLASIAASAWCAYLLAFRLTRRRDAGFLAGVVFAFAPYRVAQLCHLEMQSAMWMPLALLALHRLAEGGGPPGTPRARRVGVGAGVALGAALAAQALSGLYYFMFLVIVLAVMASVLLAAGTRAARWRMCRGLATAGLVAAVVVGPYAVPYRSARALVGTRGAEEVSQFSAAPGDYLQASPGNWLRKGRVARQSAEERSLYPGLVAPALAVVALWPPTGAWQVAAAAGLVVAYDASLGTNGWSFGAVRRVVPAIDGLRAPARFAVLVLLLLAVLAAMGLARIGARLRASWSRGVASAAILLCVVEFWAVPVAVRPLVTRPTTLTSLLASLPAGTVVLHLPVPGTGRLWLHETTYQYLSTLHWQPLVNGYSGYAPPVYVRTLDALRTFPDAESVARLRRLGVDLVVVHPELLAQGEYERMTAAMDGTGAFERVAEVSDPGLASVVFRMVPGAPGPALEDR